MNNDVQKFARLLERICQGGEVDDAEIKALDWQAEGELDALLCQVYAHLVTFSSEQDVREKDTKYDESWRIGSRCVLKELRSLADQEYLQFEQQVVQWVSEWSGIRQLSPQALLNGKPVRADGDDAVELLQHLVSRSGVEFGPDFDYDRYFGPEAGLFGWLLDCLRRRRWPWSAKRLSIRMVAQHLYERRGLSPIT